MASVLLTRESPTFCIWMREGDDGSLVCSVYSIRPLARIEILANKQTHKWTERRACGSSAVLSAHFMCVYFDRWQLYHCLMNLHMYDMSRVSYMSPAPGPFWYPDDVPFII